MRKRSPLVREKLLVAPTSEFEQAMLLALKSHKPKGPALIRRLWDSIKAIKSVPHPVEERRTVPRLFCELPVLILLDGGAKGGTLTDVGLFGLSLRTSASFPKGSSLRILLPQDEELEEVVCKVRWVESLESGYLLGLQYHQKPESLSRSWVCRLLHELGYDFEQRRQFIRAKSEIPGELAGQAGKILDIGVGGALFQGQAQMGSDVLSLSIGPFDSLDKLELKVQVKHQRADSELFSLEFIEPSKEQTSRLGDYVLKLLSKESEP